jgi:hypothetical protein
LRDLEKIVPPVAFTGHGRGDRPPSTRVSFKHEVDAAIDPIRVKIEGD